MTRKTFLDCAICSHQTECDAHITGGTHKHEEGEDPCRLLLYETDYGTLQTPDFL
jgi:hypothetical protein